MNNTKVLMSVCYDKSTDREYIDSLEGFVSTKVKLLGAGIQDNISLETQEELYAFHMNFDSEFQLEHNDIDEIFRFITIHSGKKVTMSSCVIHTVGIGAVSIVFVGQGENGTIKRWNFEVV